MFSYSLDNSISLQLNLISKIFELFDPNKTIIGGGCLRDIMMNRFNLINDIDVFTFASSFQEFERSIKARNNNTIPLKAIKYEDDYGVVVENNIQDHYLTTVNKVMRFSSTFLRKNVDITLIISDDLTLEKLIKAQLTCEIHLSRIALSNIELHISPDFIEDATNKTITIVNNSNEKSDRARINRYREKICRKFPDFIEISNVLEV